MEMVDSFPTLTKHRGIVHTGYAPVCKTKEHVMKKLIPVLLSLFMVVVIIAALTFVPALVLGTLTEHMILWG